MAVSGGVREGGAGRILIRSEADLFEAIASLERGEMPDEVRIETAERWARFEVTLRGEDFAGGVPTRIMPSLLEVQKAINGAYARAAGRVRLTQEERRRTELIVRLEPGSTTFTSELAPALNNALLAAIKNMSGPESLIAILSVVVVAGGYAGWKAYLRYKAERHGVDAQVQMSAQETERARIIAELARGNPHVQTNLNGMNVARDMMLVRLEDDDELLVAGEPLVRGEVARRIAKPPPPVRVHDRLDGNFMILSVVSGKIRSGFRARVQNVEDGSELTVTIPEGTLTRDQIEALQEGEWGKTPLHMQINITRAREQIVDATLISAGLRAP